MEDFQIKYKSLVEQIPGALIFSARLDQNSYSDLFIGPQIEDILGFTVEEWLGDSLLWYRQIHPDDRDILEEKGALLCAEGKPISTDMRLISKNGKTVWFRVEVRIIIKDTTPVLIHGIAFDITTRKESELALEKTSKMMTHDLKTPIRGVNSIAEWIEIDKDNILSKESQEYLKLLHKYINKMNDTINMFLKYINEERSKTST